MQFRNLKIRQKIVLLFLPLPLLAILTVGSFWYWSALNAIEESLKEQTSALAQNASFMIEDYLSQRKLEVRSVSRLIWVEDFFKAVVVGKPVRNEYSVKLKTLLLDLSDRYFQITCTNNQGQPFSKVQLTSMFPREEIPVYFENRIFDEQDKIGITEGLYLMPGEIYVSNVKNIRGSKSLLLATSVMDSHLKQKLGLLTFILPVVRMANKIENYNSGLGGRAMVLDETGELLYHSDRKKINQNINASMPNMAKFFDPKMAVHTNSETYNDDNDTTWIISFSHIKNTPWWVAIASPLQTSLASTERAGTFGIAATVGISILLLILSNTLSKRFVRDISEVTEGARAIAAGNLNRQLSVRSNDEIGELARDFNKMTSDLKQLVQERQTNETLVAIGRFSTALAHDMRNPVEGLRLLVVQLKLRLQQTQPAFEVAEVISQSVERLSSFITNSLDFARLNQPAFTETDLKALAEQVLAEFSFQQVELKRNYADELPKIHADASQIKRVLANLIRNALDACLSNSKSPSHQITLTLRTQEGKVILEVKDTGGGIPPEIQEKIYEPFFSTKSNGYGLGLAFVQQIITNHGGKISFRSKSGKGAQFIVELPCQKF